MKLLVMTENRANKILDIMKALLEAGVALGAYDDEKIAVLKARIAVVESFIAAMTEVNTTEMDKSCDGRLCDPSEYIRAQSKEGKNV